MWLNKSQRSEVLNLAELVLAAVISKNAYSPEHSRRVYSGVNLSHCSPFSPKRPILFKDSACARWGPVRFWETWTRGLTKPLVFPSHPSLKLQLSCHWLNWPCTWGFISTLSILFHWSLCLSSCQHHTVLIAVTLWWVLKPGMENSPTLSFPPPPQDCFGYLGANGSFQAGNSV